VVACCPRLRELKLLQCKSLQSQALRALLPLPGDRRPQFSALLLDLSYCHLPTTADIAAVLLCSNHLQVRFGLGGRNPKPQLNLRACQ
jgi:hypothetical protein